jgi:hypothetical protein
VFGQNGWLHEGLHGVPSPAPDVGWREILISQVTGAGRIVFGVTGAISVKGCIAMPPSTKPRVGSAVAEA